MLYIKECDFFYGTLKNHLHNLQQNIHLFEGKLIQFIIQIFNKSKYSYMSRNKISFNASVKKSGVMKAI